MKILEFTGAPGIGKSTLCYQVMSVLTQKGYRVVNLQRYLPGNTIFQKIYRKYRYHMIWHARINRDIIRAGKRLNIPMDDAHKEWMDRILLVNYEIHTRGKSYDYLFLDEGMIQFITSLYHDKKMDNPEEIRSFIGFLCPEYLQNTEIIYMTLNLTTICERLKHRNRTGDRFLSGDEEQMKDSLQQKLDNIEFTLQASGVPIYHLECDNTSNALLLQDILKNCL